MNYSRFGSCTRLFSCLVVTTAAVLPVAAQTIQFNSVAPNLIEARLQKAPADNQARFDTLKKLFEEAGCKQLSEQAVKGAAQPNVLCTLPGSSSASIVVGAHFDKGKKGDGIIDNWAGAALLPSLYQSLSAHPRKVTFVFVGFSEKEKGLAGSKAYVKEMTAEQRAGAKAMVNVDCVGLAATKLIIDKSDKNLVNSFARVAASVKVPIMGTNAAQGATKDSGPFADKKIPTIDVHSVGQEQLSVPHSEKDTLTAVSMEDYQNTFKALSAYLAFLDATSEAGAGGQ
jgi:hypothetical protein